MEHFTVEGHWWLPPDPHRRVAGTLSFSTDGLKLVVYDALRKFNAPEVQVLKVGRPEWQVEPIVHGRTRDGREFTLLEVGGANLAGPFKVVERVYRPELALAGSHTAADRFTAAWCTFDYLDAWADPPSITADGAARDSVEVRLGSVDLAHVDLSGTSVRLVSGVKGTAGGDRVELTRSTSFAVESSQDRSSKALVNDYIRPLQDLVMICLGRSVRLTSLRLVPADLADPREGSGEAYFPAVQPAPAQQPMFGDVENYSAPTILSLRHSPIDLEQILVRWFESWESRREVLALVLSPLYAPFIYSEHGFGSTFQGAEGLHDLVLSGRDVVKAEHRQRVSAVVEAMEMANLDAATITWASNVLASRNDKPLSRKVEDLLKSTGVVGEAVLRADPSFGPTTARARTGVSHPGAEKHLDSVGRYWYGQILRWVVRTRILMDLVDDPEEIQRRVVERTPFQHALKEIENG